MEKTILITGGAGFIGSHVVRWFVHHYPQYQILNLDLLTYAGNLENLADIEHQPNYRFIKGDITDEHFIEDLFTQYPIDAVIHLAAESHVDRSIMDPLAFVRTNVLGTAVLLNACRRRWTSDPEKHLFYQVSTDEVYGSLGPTGYFSEQSKYDPRSPYAASKAGADHLVRAYFHTYQLPVVISNCSNNYGPYQFPEKLIPLVIRNVQQNKPVPVYGRGENVRDWLWVEDHVRAIDLIFHRGKRGETYTVGGHNEWKNIDLVKLICRCMDEKLGRAPGSSEQLITFVKDRAGHDLRYAIDASRIRQELGWQPTISFEEGIRRTIDWYLSHQEWLEHVTSGSYQQYYEQQYILREHTQPS